MGCVMDTPPRVRQRLREPNSRLASPKAMVSARKVDKDTLREDFNLIMQGIQRIPKPDDTGPVACFSNQSLPIVIAPLCLREGDETGVTLPVIGISHYQLGRAAIMGNTKLISDEMNEDTDSSAFLENVVKWLSGIQRGRISVCVIGYSEQVTAQIEENLSGFGFKISKADVLDITVRAQVLIVESSYDDSDGKVVEFVENGGGVLCTLQPPGDLPDQSRYVMNSSMSIFGLGFVSTALLVGPVNSSNLRITSHVSILQKYTFASLSATMIDVLNKKDVELAELDSCVISVRFTVSCMPQSDNPDLLTLEQAAYKYLKEHDYETEEGYCAAVYNSVVAVLLCEIQAKMSACCFAGHDFSDRFPGKVSEEPDDNDIVTTQLVLQEEGWVSTGFWVPAGIVATISTEDELPPGLIVQAGMHTESIFHKEGPWKRWPIVTTSFDFKQTTEIANPFGGMIYIILNHTLEEPITLDLTINNVFPYPRFSLAQRKLWEETRDRGAPWAEVETKYITFVAPAQIVRSAKDLCNNAMMIDDLIESVLAFLDDKQQHKFRCVFDIELGDEPVCGYPIIMSIDQCEAFFDEIKPSEPLFVLTTFIGMLSLPEGAFETEKENSLAYAATCAAFLKKWPDVSPLDFSRDMLPRHFNELWNIYKKDNGRAMTRAMGVIRAIVMSDLSDNGDQWALFINQIQSQLGMDLNHLIDSNKKSNDKGGVVLSMSSASLQNFQLVDEI